MSIARKYKPPVCAFSLVDMHAETHNSKYAKKMSGSTLAGIFNMSPFNTPFIQACNLMGICKEDLDGQRSIEIGKELEEDIIAYIGERYPDFGIFVPAKALFGEKTGEHDTWKSDFEDPWFSGNMDGMVFDDEYSDVEKRDGYILEIKTTSNHESWSMGVPEYYRIQVELYNHFLPTPKNKAYVAVCLIDEKTRKDTANWVPSDDNIFLFEMSIDDTEVQKKLDKAIEWYKQYVIAGITPDFDPANKKDAAMWAHLVAITSGGDDIQADIDRLEELEEEIAVKETEMKPLSDERETLRAKIKDYMVNNKVQSIGATSGKNIAVISSSNRTSIDKKLLEKDGIDPAKYTVIKTIQTFSLKPVKEENNQEGE